MWTLPSCARTPRDSHTFPTCSRVMTGVSRANQPSSSATYGRSLTSRPRSFNFYLAVMEFGRVGLLGGGGGGGGGGGDCGPV